MSEGYLTLPRLSHILAMLKPLTMATIENNFMLRGAKGQVGQQVVLKRYGRKTVIRAYPDMSNVKPSKQ